MKKSNFTPNDFFNLLLFPLVSVIGVHKNEEIIK